MRQKGLTLIKGFVCLMLMTLIYSTGLVTTDVQAAEKPSIQDEMEIGRGSTGIDGYMYNEGYVHTLEVFNPVKKATYSFTSSDKAVVTVKSKGNKAYVTGVKVGKATITCTQKLNGKTTKVGTCKVKVNDVVIYGEDFGSLPLGENQSVYIYYAHRNNDATYTFASDSKNFTMKEKVVKEDGWNYVVQSYTAKKPGKYKVTVKETYKKKTRNVGTAEFEIVKVSVIPEASIFVGDNYWAFELMSGYRSDVDYRFDFGEEEIVDFYVTEGTVYYKGLKPGTVEVKISEGATETEPGEFVGSCMLTVKELKIEGLDGAISNTKSYVGGDDVELYIYKEPYNAPEEVTVTSSDTKIASVGKLDENGIVLITPVSEGTVTITITCGELTKTEKFTVYVDEDEYNDHYYDEE